MERHFDAEMKKLNEDLLKMAAKAEDAIYKAIEALKTLDKEMAMEIIGRDGIIDEMELAIEEKVITLLATRQPIAADLRFLTAGMKINEELERIADLAVNIAQRVLDLVDKPLLSLLTDIPRLSEVVRGMVKGAIDAFVARDENAAKEVILADSEADKFRNKIYDEIVYGHIMKDSSVAPQVIPLLLISRHLERIADHATYIAEDVIYMIKAKVVRHHLERLDNGRRDKLPMKDSV